MAEPGSKASILYWVENEGSGFHSYGIGPKTEHPVKSVVDKDRNSEYL